MTPTSLHRSSSSDGHPLLSRSERAQNAATADYLRWWHLTGQDDAVSREIAAMANRSGGVRVQPNG